MATGVRGGGGSLGERGRRGEEGGVDTKTWGATCGGTPLPRCVSPPCPTLSSPPSCLGSTPRGHRGAREGAPSPFRNAKQGQRFFFFFAILPPLRIGPPCFGGWPLSSPVPTPTSTLHINGIRLGQDGEGAGASMERVGGSVFLSSPPGARERSPPIGGPPPKLPSDQERAHLLRDLVRCRARAWHSWEGRANNR